MFLGKNGGEKMLDLLRKTFLAGIGVFSLTKEMTEKLYRELVEKGQMSAEEAKKFVNELEERGEQEKAALSEAIKKEMERWRVEMGLVSKNELELLEQRVKELEGKVAALEKQGQ